MLALRQACVLAVVAFTALTVAAKEDQWVEVRSAHFVVITDSSQKQAQSVAEEFERMRALFQKIFPPLKGTAEVPITVLAVRNEKEFRALEPEAYLAKGGLRLAGYFLRAADSNLVLLRLDVGGEHPYAVIYHEYTHFLLRNVADVMPLWLNEGLAQFYQNTEVSAKSAIVGMGSQQNIYLLNQNRLLPLPTLLTVDHNSPYYHQENSGSIFYAESWALTHMLLMKDIGDRTNKLHEYLVLVGKKVDPVAAATQIFGDLNVVQKALESYVQQSRFYQLEMHGGINIGDVEFKGRTVPSAEAAALRARFLAYNRRNTEARELLQATLKDDPNNVAAMETMGFLSFQGGNMEEARSWYEKAIKLDSRSYLAHYYYAAIGMRSGNTDADERARIEKSLRTAVELNPAFAPAYDLLGMVLTLEHKDLNEAYRMALHAVELDPTKVAFRLNSANILMSQGRTDDAILAMQSAMKVASTPEDTAHIQNAMEMVNRYREFQQSRDAAMKSADRRAAAEAPVSDTTTSSPERPALRRRGPKKTVTGTIQQVQCSVPSAMDLEVAVGKGTIKLHSDNYYKIAFSALEFNPTGELHPCSDIQGMTAKIDYEGGTDDGQNYIVAVELHK